MKEYDLLTGAEIPEEGAYVSPIKQMCLNCLFMSKNASYTCSNENVIETGKKKILAAVPEGFEIDTLTLKPMTLKNPTKKCANYCLDKETVMQEVMSILGPI